MRSVFLLLPFLLGACARVPMPETRAVTPRTVMEMQLRSRAETPAGPGVPGVEADRLNGSARLETVVRPSDTSVSGSATR